MGAWCRIQASARRKSARATVATLRRQQMIERHAAIRIQCFWRQKMSRRALERRRATKRLEARRAAALRIQVRAAMRPHTDSIYSLLNCRRIGGEEWLANGCIENANAGKRQQDHFILRYSRTGLTTTTGFSMSTRFVATLKHKFCYSKYSIAGIRMEVAIRAV